MGIDGKWETGIIPICSHLHAVQLFAFYAGLGETDLP